MGYLLFFLASIIILAGADKSLEGLQTAEQVARKHLVSPEGQAVRVVGLNPKSGSTVVQNSLGETVEADVANAQQGTCNVVIWNYAKADETLQESFTRKSLPVLIPDSCVSGICLWTVMLRGDDCLKIADSAHYVGSTMKEFMAMDKDTKKRFLKTYGTCTTDKVEHRCVVPLGDKRAIQGEAIFFGGTSWAGRTDLDFYKFENGELRSK